MGNKLKEKSENEVIKRILSLLDTAKSPVPLGYISLHTKIKDPNKILRSMEDNGLVRRCKIPKWSYSLYPLFETTSTKERMY